MGQARQKKLAGQSFEQVHQKWLSELSDQERVIADVVTTVHQKIVKEGGMFGACYHLSFFLKRYLKKEKGIDVDVVVGWVGEGSWQGVASHAWIEFNGKKIDVALSKTEHPEAQPTGAFILLDRVVRKGMTEYSYHRDIPEFAKRTMADMASSPQTSESIRVTHARHASMLAMTDDEAAIDEYLRTVPTGGNYDVLVARAKLPVQASV